MATTTGQLLTYVENKTQAGSGTLNNTTVGLPFLNEAMLDFRTDLIKRGIDASQIQESYVPTVTPASLPSGSTFSYPSDMYFLKTISVNFTDSSAMNYVQAQLVDVSNTPGQASFEFLRANQPSSEPLFDDRGDTYEIFPSFTSATNLVNAIRIFYFLQPTPYTTTGDTLAYPDSLDWYALADRTAALYYESLNKFVEADYWRKLSNSRIEKMVDTLETGSEQPLQATSLPITGFEF
jgi:hypothetical protein